MPDLPTRFAVPIITFASLFVQRLWLHAQVLLVGAILPPGRRTVASVPRIEYATLEWVDWFNHRRLLERFGYIPPAEAEAAFYTALEATPMAAWHPSQSALEKPGAVQ